MDIRDDEGSESKHSAREKKEIVERLRERERERQRGGKEEKKNE